MNLENTKETGKLDFSGLDFSNNKNKSEINHLKTRIDEYEKNHLLDIDRLLGHLPFLQGGFRNDKGWRHRPV